MGILREIMNHKLIFIETQVCVGGGRGTASHVPNPPTLIDAALDCRTHPPTYTPPHLHLHLPPPNHPTPHHTPPPPTHPRPNRT